MKKYLMILALSAVTGQAAAQGICLLPPPTAPSPINGIQASAEEITAYRTEVVEYLAKAEKRLICMEPSLRYNSLSYNRMVYQMNEVSQTFNQELAKYYSQVAAR